MVNDYFTGHVRILICIVYSVFSLHCFITIANETELLQVSMFHNFFFIPNLSKEKSLMKKICALFGILMLLLIAGIATAKPVSPDVARAVFSQMDANGDKVISVTEHAAFWQGRFKEMDTNKDGKVSAEEFKAATKKFFGDMDVDKNGALVGKEYIAFWCGPKAKVPAKIKAEPMKKLDANNDGIISDDECVAFWAANFYDIDQNHDGKISLEEFMAAMTKRFKEIDKNRDGFISIQEHSYFWSGKTKSVK